MPNAPRGATVVTRCPISRSRAAPHREPRPGRRARPPRRSRSQSAGRSPPTIQEPDPPLAPGPGRGPGDGRTRRPRDRSRPARRRGPRRRSPSSCVDHRISSNGWPGRVGKRWQFARSIRQADEPQERHPRRHPERRVERVRDRLGAVRAGRQGRGAGRGHHPVEQRPPEAGRPGAPAARTASTGTRADLAAERRRRTRRSAARRFRRPARRRRTVRIGRAEVAVETENRRRDRPGCRAGSGGSCSR